MIEEEVQNYGFIYLFYKTTYTKLPIQNLYYRIQVAAAAGG